MDMLTAQGRGKEQGMAVCFRVCDTPGTIYSVPMKP